MTPQERKDAREISFVVSALNAARAAVGVKRIRIQSHAETTREAIRAAVVQIWSKYPGALDRNDFELGEFTLELVKSEVEQMISDRRRGVKVRKVGFVRTPYHGQT